MIWLNLTATTFNRAKSLVWYEHIKFAECRKFANISEQATKDVSMSALGQVGMLRTLPVCLIKMSYRSYVGQVGWHDGNVFLLGLFR